jgi:hypothetical protein
MDKIRLEDLVVINYRLGGLADKVPETPQIVLVNRIKNRVRSQKELSWIYV